MKIFLQKMLISLLCLLAFPLVALADKPADERVYIVNDYRYLPGTPADDTETGQSLCGNRCNAMSFDYLNVSEAGGWRILKVAADSELIVDLDNPFMEGKCVCVADEYVVQIDDSNWPSPQKR